MELRWGSDIGRRHGHHHIRCESRTFSQAVDIITMDLCSKVLQHQDHRFLPSLRLAAEKLPEDETAAYKTLLRQVQAIP